MGVTSQDFHCIAVGDILEAHPIGCKDLVTHFDAMLFCKSTWVQPEERMPGILPTRLSTILSLLLPVRTFTALLMVMLSRLTPFTSTSLSPTVSPACAADTRGTQQR
ncbi:unnamed protein product [Menidia menidia]|uniref:(Atlantic silverside) hypothetical protein n=1 Tax=Menidia menidia TaxID=238744 RepID=A0A8S4C081_9TELE|nr:unnamed protein product [Menidia menidia]